MLTKSSATARLSRHIVDNESAIAAAIASTSKTLATASLAQVQVPGAPTGDAQEAIIRLQKAQAKLIEAQTEMLRAHAKMRDISKVVNGPEEPTCPDNGFTSAKLVEGSRVS